MDSGLALRAPRNDGDGRGGEYQPGTSCDHALIQVFCPTLQVASARPKFLKRFNPTSTVHGVVFRFLSSVSAPTNSDGFRFALAILRVLHHRHPEVPERKRRPRRATAPLHPLGRSSFEALHATRCVAWLAPQDDGTGMTARGAEITPPPRASSARPDAPHRCSRADARQGPLTSRHSLALPQTRPCRSRPLAPGCSSAPARASARPQ